MYKLRKVNKRQLKEAQLRDNQTADSSFRQYKQNPDILFSWDRRTVENMLYATVMRNCDMIGDPHYSQRKQFADILLKRTKFLNSKEIHERFKKKPEEKQNEFSFWDDVKWFFTIQPSRESKLTSLEKVEIFDQERIETYSKRNEMGEIVTYIVNPPPKLGFRLGTNIPRELYKEEYEKIAKKYKNDNDKVVSSNASSTNKVDCQKIH